MIDFGIREGLSKEIMTFNLCWNSLFNHFSGHAFCLKMNILLSNLFLYQKRAIDVHIIVFLSIIICFLTLVKCSGHHRFCSTPSSKLSFFKKHTHFPGRVNAK